MLWVRRNVYVTECFADFDGWDVYGVALPEVQAAEPAGDAGNRYGSGTYVLDLLDGSILGISPELRKMALIIILTRAGLGLDTSGLKSWGGLPF